MLSRVCDTQNPLIHSPCKTAGFGHHFQAAIYVPPLCYIAPPQDGNLSVAAKQTAFPVMTWQRKMGV